MTIPVPTLSASGWVTSPAEKADYLMAHFFSSDQAQTYFYPGNAFNLQGIMQAYSRNIPELIRELEQRLSAYFGRYYDTAKFEVTSNEAINLDDPSLRITISGQLTSNNKKIALGQLYGVTKGHFRRVIDEINGGVTITG